MRGERGGEFYGHSWVLAMEGKFSEGGMGFDFMVLASIWILFSTVTIK
jgi:hypothetical protein